MSLVFETVHFASPTTHFISYFSKVARGKNFLSEGGNIEGASCTRFIALVKGLAGA